LRTDRPDQNGDLDTDGFSNLEEYLNDLAAFKAVGPVEYTGLAGGRYAQSYNWIHRWEPSRLDDVHVDVAGVRVDAVGQRAGTLKIGTTPGAAGSLDIVGGWLEVTDEVVVGADLTATAALNLSGGKLSTHELSMGPGGAFNFTGGVLSANIVNFELMNQGGTLAPGQSVGQTHVMDDLMLMGGALAIELASTSVSDTLLIDGTAQLGGALNVSLLGSFTPVEGNSWNIIAADGLDGMFSSVTPGYSVQKQGSNLVLYFGAAPAPLTPGDFNGDFVVDAADYSVWRNHLGSDFDLNGSGDEEDDSFGTVDEADYELWRRNYGTVYTPGEGGVAQTRVPEPAAAIMLLTGVVAGKIFRRRARV
jgi:hypothetical protein